MFCHHATPASCLHNPQIACCRVQIALAEAEALFGSPCSADESMSMTWSLYVAIVRREVAVRSVFQRAREAL